MRVYRKLFEPLGLIELPRSQRRFVYRQCIHPLLARWPLLLSKSALWTVIFLVGYYFAAFETTLRLLLLFLAAVAGDEILRLILMRHYRSEVATYLREHAAEIRAGAERPCALPNGSPANPRGNVNAAEAPPSVRSLGPLP